MILSKANSIRFYKPDGLMMNFDNKRSDIVFGGMIGYCFAHKYLNTDQIPIEIGVTDGVEPTMSYITNHNSITITPYYSETISSITYYYYKLNQQESGYLKITNGTETWYSEQIEIVKTTPAIKIEWYNFDDAFGFHYRDDMVNFIRLNGAIKSYAPEGKATIFDNQNEEVKLKEVLYRQRKLILEPVPDSIAEKLTIAAAHDLFLVNDVEYVTSNFPSIKELGFANLYEVEFTLKEKFAIGINRHTSKFVPTPAAYYTDAAGNQYTDDSGNYYTN